MNNLINTIQYFLYITFGALIYGYVLQNVVVRIIGDGHLFAVPVLKLEFQSVWHSAQKGMNIGTVIALIIGGASMAIPEMAMLASIFKKKLVGAIVIVIWFTAVVGGYLFNIIL